jgi:hypothetical protein
MWFGAVVTIVFAVTVAAAATKLAVTLSRRRRLRNRFGAEYERLADDRDSKKQADLELKLRERYVRQLGVEPLDPDTRNRYATRWGFALDRFAYDPAGAVEDAHRLLLAVLREYGYPIMHREQVISDLSVDHSNLLDHFRSACDICERSAAGVATAQDMCRALADYSSMFAELLAPAEPVDVEAAGLGAIARAEPGLNPAKQGS